VNISLNIPSDDDGFLSRECPTCLGTFKARVIEGGITVHFCPYCGHEGDDCWWTSSQLAYARAAAMEALSPTIDAMFDGLGSASGGLIKVSVERSTPERPVLPVEISGTEEIHSFECCGTEAKIERHLLTTSAGTTAPVTCISCGTVSVLPEATR
jgi:hypothetical protein